MWIHPVTNKTLISGIEAKLVEITAVIKNNRLLFEEDFGLLTGQTGALLYANYHDLLRQDSVFYDYTETSVLTLFENIEAVNTAYISNGLSGILWALNHLNEKKFIEIDEDIFIITKKLISANVTQCSESNNFDFLQGALGISLYLKAKPALFDRSLTEQTFLTFYNSSEVDNRFLKRVTTISYDTGIKGYCMGLAHGVPSVILTIIKYLRRYNDPLVMEILNKTINFLLSAKKESPDKAYFPSNIIGGEGDYTGRLAWCYGDMGCAISLYKAGEFLARKDLIKTSIEIMTFAAKKRELDESRIRDTGICHGTAGIAHMFARFYNYTGKDHFREASEHWFLKTLEMASFNDGLAGFKQFNGYTQEYENKMCLLQGISGIGLTLISSISNIEPDWDECLLLS